MKKMTKFGIAAVLSTAILQGAWGQSKNDFQAPTLVGSSWLNTNKADIDTLKNMKGHVTVIHFFTFGCINCKRNLSSYETWFNKYKSSGVKVIGIHTPELKDEFDPIKVKQAMADLKVDYPVLIDNDSANWNRYKVNVWPTVYIVDKAGKLRHYWRGELGWNGANGFQELSKVIQQLMKEPG